MQARWLTGAAAVTVMAAGGYAAAQMAPRIVTMGTTPNNNSLLERLHQGAVLEQYLAQVVALLRSADRDGNGLDAGDVALAKELQQAQNRASSISMALRYDLNGDYKVTRKELERASDSNAEYRERNVTGMLEQYDADGDDVISLAEAADGQRETYRDEQLEALLKLDPSGDGVLTADELGKLAAATFARVDRDGDGRISPEEYKPIVKQVQELSVARNMAQCELPKLPDNAELVVFGAYEGDSISSAVVGGQEQETNLIDVNVEPGSRPLYLILTSYESMVWRFTGATNRVANVVISSTNGVRAVPADGKPLLGGGTATGSRGGGDSRFRTSASGVAGIPASKVAITSPGCPGYFSSAEEGASSVTRGVVRNALGREPDKTFGRYTVQRISVPSGTMASAKPEATPMPRGFDPRMWGEAVRFWPGGLVAVDPNKVVARAKVERYQVLPSQMGLAQLVGSGAIEHQQNDRFRIVRPIPWMPPSMGGAHSVTLVLAKGVPMPKGSPVHSCVIREDNGQSEGAACRD